MVTEDTRRRWKAAAKARGIPLCDLVTRAVESSIGEVPRDLDARVAQLEAAVADLSRSRDG